MKRINQNKRIQILRKENVFLFSATIMMFVLFIGAIFIILQQEPIETKEAEPKVQPSFAEISKGAVTMKIPAVDKEGNGVVTSLAVKATKGQGKTLIDINSLFFFIDTQESIQTAKQVSSDITNLDLSNYDITYTIFAEANSIGGPSAGAALTIATIAALQNLKLRDDVIITGRVLSDGTIGNVNSILEKAEVAQSTGANLFLVPPNQGKEIVFGSEKVCETEGIIEVCTIKTKSTEMDLEAKVEIKIEEISTIQEALDYFTN